MSVSARYISALPVIAFFFISSAYAQTPPGRLETARKVLEAGGTTEAMIATIRANLPTQRAANPQIPAEFWTRFEQEIIRRAPEFIDSVATLYAQRLTQADLEAVLRFYESPAGRRLRDLQPTLITESSAIGRRWGMRIGAEIGASLQQKPQ